MNPRIPSSFPSLILMMILFGGWALPVHASSKIWEGVVVKVSGSSVSLKPQYTPYASATLYPKYCDTEEKEGALLVISFSNKQDRGRVHVPFIDDVPVTAEELLAAAKPGMRMIGFMNRKQWHYVSLVVRNAGVEVGYVQGVEGGTLKLSRPQANWPNQMSNAKSFSAKDFPDRQFSLELPDDMAGVGRKGEEVSVQDLLKPGRPVMLIPGAAMRVEWIPNAAERWIPTQEPLLGNFGEYELRRNPKLNETFYRGAVTGTLLEGKAVKRSVQNFLAGSEKPMESWKLDVPYGPNKGEYILPSRGHKTLPIVAGHFNSFPQFNVMKPGRRVTAWSYRNQKAPNWILFDAAEMVAEGRIQKVQGRTVTLVVSTLNGDEEKEITLDPDSIFHRLGVQTDARSVLTVGQIIRIYPSHPFTVVSGMR